MNDHIDILYERIRDHMSKQGQRSVDEDGSCVYRSPEGLSCPAGACIDDDHYNESLEGIGVSDPYVYAAIEASMGFGLTWLDLIFLSMTQIIHDTVPPDQWSYTLSSLHQATRMKKP